MKRFFLSLTFCCLVLFSGALLLSRSSAAAGEDLVSALLKLPAPPPANPLVSVRDRSEKFFDRKSPPPDDAPIEDLLDYWRHQSTTFRSAAYNPKPSEAALARMIPEIEVRPDSVFKYLNVLGHSPAGVDMVKRIHDTLDDNEPDAKSLIYEGEEDSRKDRLRNWLTAHSPHFAADLERKARQSGDVDGYVGNQDAFHSLTKADWDRARAMVDRMYADSSQPASQALARWALYRNAMATGSAEVERFRDELKAAVENRELSYAIRDLSLDALLMEKEWSGRDDWYFSLMSDETLVMLRPYTGLTTLILHSPDDKYLDKMIELSKSENRVIRTAAVRNLLVRLDAGGPETVRALIPWLNDPAWVLEGTEGRDNVVQKLAEVKVPESVPALIKALNEIEEVKPRPVAANVVTNSNFNSLATRDIRAAANAVNAAANAVANAANSISNSEFTIRTETPYLVRYPLIRALATQADSRAVPILRRVLPKVEPYERILVIQALLASNGFSVIEQADAVEYVAEKAAPFIQDVDEDSGAASNAMSTYGWSNANIGGGFRQGPPDPESLKQLLGMNLLATPDVSDALIRELVSRIDAYEKTDPSVAEALRRIFVNWKGAAVNALLLRDLKNDRSNIAAVVRLLGARKDLREKQSADVFDVRTGSPTALGISACLLESEQDYTAILAGQSADAKAALFACGRLVRAPLPVKEAARYLDSSDKRLARAAEVFLESEDSPEARAIVLSRHPNSAKILGATTAFWPEDLAAKSSANYLTSLAFGFLFPNPVNAGPYLSHSSSEEESKVREELKNSNDLAGIYSYEENSVRIYKEKVVLQWTEDESRYRERPLTKDEFAELTEYLDKHNAADLRPFLDCRSYDCESRRLVMVGKTGGRRVFSLTERLPKFFAGLDDRFTRLRKTPGRLRYNLEKEVPGLEIIFSDDKFGAETVWKNGSDLRVLITDKVKRQGIDRDLKNQTELMREDESQTDYDDVAIEKKISDLREERDYDAYAWYEVSAGRLASVVSQPLAAEYIPVKDSFSVKPDFGNWTAKTGSLELRAGSDGLYLISGPKISRFAAGGYHSPVITANGKWAAALKYSEEEASKLVRINLATKRQFPVKSGEYSTRVAIAYVPALNKFLLTDEYYYEERSHREFDADSTYWLDPDTGAVTPVKGEVRPIGHQTFRSLQPTGKPNEFWAAIPDREKRTTAVGLYDSRALTFKPVLVIPKISFNSMDMWVDSAENKVYFVYSGHLLSLPLVKK